jgi:hypothetical protein
MGVDWTFGGQGHGYAIPWNNLILSGDAEFREANRHELVHYMMAPLLETARPHPLVNEGIATWLGGSVGRTYADLVHEYAALIEDNPISPSMSCSSAVGLISAGTLLEHYSSRWCMREAAGPA